MFKTHVRKITTYTLDDWSIYNEILLLKHQSFKATAH